MHQVKRRVQPLTEQELAKWIRPNYAYVLLETIEFAIKQGGQKDIVHKLMTIRVEDRPDRLEAIRFYTSLDGPKRFRLIDWGNFPTSNDENSKKRMMVQMHSEGGRRNVWKEIERLCESLLQVEPIWSRYYFDKAEKEKAEALPVEPVIIDEGPFAAKVSRAEEKRKRAEGQPNA